MRITGIQRGFFCGSYGRWDRVGSYLNSASPARGEACVRACGRKKRAVCTRAIRCQIAGRDQSAKFESSLTVRCRRCAFVRASASASSLCASWPHRGESGRFHAVRARARAMMRCGCGRAKQSQPVLRPWVRDVIAGMWRWIRAFAARAAITERRVDLDRSAGAKTD